MHSLADASKCPDRGLNLQPWHVRQHPTQLSYPARARGQILTGPGMMFTVYLRNSEKPSGFYARQPQGPIYAFKAHDLGKSCSADELLFFPLGDADEN